MSKMKTNKRMKIGKCKDMGTISRWLMIIMWKSNYPILQNPSQSIWLDFLCSFSIGTVAVDYSIWMDFHAAILLEFCDKKKLGVL